MKNNFLKIRQEICQSHGKQGEFVKFAGIWFSFGLVWFYGISTIIGYLMPNPFYTIKQFYFKQFDLA